MIIAFLTTVTLLPALLSALKPAGEPAPVGWAALAPLDRFLDRRRNWVVGLTLAAVILGLPLLGGLRFDFNPLDLRSKQVELVSTLLDLMRDPDTSPNTIESSSPTSPAPPPSPKSSSGLPEVAKVRTLESFVPKDQDEKLALIDDASFFFENTLTPAQVAPAPTPAETLEAINKTAADLSGAAKGLDSPAATQARRLAGALTALAKAPRGAKGRGRASPGHAAHDHASGGERSPDRRTCDDRHASAVAQERLGRGRRRGQDRGRAERRRQRQRRAEPVRRRGPNGSAAGVRRAGLHRRGRGDHRQGVPSGGGLVGGVDCAHPLCRRCAAGSTSR